MMVDTNMKTSNQGFQNYEMKKPKAPRVIIKLTEHSRLKKSNTKPSTPKNSSSQPTEEPIKSTPKSSLPAEDNIIATAKISTILRKLRLSQSSCEEESDIISECINKQINQHDNGFQLQQFPLSRVEIKSINEFCSLIYQEPTLINIHNELICATREYYSHINNSFQNQMVDEDCNLQQIGNLKNYGQSKSCQPHQSTVKKGSSSICNESTPRSILKKFKEKEQVAQDSVKGCKSNNKSMLPPTVSKTSTNYTETSHDSKCYNCKSPEHNYLKCREPQKVKCKRCGWGYVTQETCPFCTGTLVRPGSTVRVPVGGDLKKKYPGVRL